MTIQFGVGDAVYLRASYDDRTDSRASYTDTPNDIGCTSEPSAISVSSDFLP